MPVLAVHTSLIEPLPHQITAVYEEMLTRQPLRFLLADLFPFGRNARIHLEHGGANDMAERYRTVTYWYGLPAASLIQTDRLTIGDEGTAMRAKAMPGENPDTLPKPAETATITIRQR